MKTIEKSLIELMKSRHYIAVELTNPVVLSGCEDDPIIVDVVRIINDTLYVYDKNDEDGDGNVKTNWKLKDLHDDLQNAIQKELKETIKS